MFELTVINVIQIIAMVCMMFFWGLSMERSRKTQEIAKMAWWISLVIMWICILVR